MYKHLTPSHSKKSTPILAAHRQVGAVKDNVFQKHVQGSRHFLRKPPAIALDVGSLVQARAHGAEVVEIIDTESGLIYRASFQTVNENGFRFDRGFGRQIGLEFRHWSIGKKQEAPVMETLPLGI